MKETATKKQYLVISSYERDIEEPAAFNTHKQAFEAMVTDMCHQLDSDEISAWKLKKHFKAGTLDTLDGYNDEFGIGNDSAWVNNNYNFDWKIVCLTVQDNRIIKCE